MPTALYLPPSASVALNSLSCRYGIPSLYSEDFETLMLDIAAEMGETERDVDLLYQLLMVVPPSVVQGAGIQVCRTFQEPGQFVVTFPQAYHAGFSHGLNLAEAVNFASADWLPFGRRAVERYRASGSDERTMCFSHEQVLLDLAAHIRDHPRNQWAV